MPIAVILNGAADGAKDLHRSINGDPWRAVRYRPPKSRNLALQAVGYIPSSRPAVTLYQRNHEGFLISGVFGGSRGHAFGCDRVGVTDSCERIAPSCREQLYEFGAYFLQFSRADRSCAIQDNARLGREEAIRANITGLA